MGRRETEHGGADFLQIVSCGISMAADRGSQVVHSSAGLYSPMHHFCGSVIAIVIRRKSFPALPDFLVPRLDPSCDAGVYRLSSLARLMLQTADN